MWSALQRVDHMIRIGQRPINWVEQPARLYSFRWESTCREYIPCMSPSIESTHTNAHLLLQICNKSSEFQTKICSWFSFAFSRYSVRIIKAINQIERDGRAMVMVNVSNRQFKACKATERREHSKNAIGFECTSKSIPIKSVCCGGPSRRSRANQRRQEHVKTTITNDDDDVDQVSTEWCDLVTPTHFGFRFASNTRGWNRMSYCTCTRARVRAQLTAGNLMRDCANRVIHSFAEWMMKKKKISRCLLGCDPSLCSDSRDHVGRNWRCGRRRPDDGNINPNTQQ